MEEFIINIDVKKVRVIATSLLKNVNETKQTLEDSEIGKIGTKNQLRKSLKLLEKQQFRIKSKITDE